MTPPEQQIIDSMFQRLAQAAAQAGPRDPQAEAYIQQRLASFPGGPYYMAQALILQERALQQAEARLAQPGAGQGSFLPGGAGPGGPAGPRYQGAPTPGPYPPQPPYQPSPGYPPPAGGGGVGGFLASAGKMALGVGGGILVADAAMGLAHDLFGQHDSNAAIEQAYDQGFQRGFDQGDQQGLEQGAQADPGQGSDQTLLDDTQGQWDQPDDQGDYQLDDYQLDDGDFGDDGGQSW
jgi:hypothetical protein